MTKPDTSLCLIAILWGTRIIQITITNLNFIRFRILLYVECVLLLLEPYLFKVF